MRTPLILALVSAAATAACDNAGGRMFQPNRVKPIVSALSSDDPEVRTQAYETLRETAKKGLSAREGGCALRAATHSYKPLKFAWQDASEELVLAAAARPRREYVSLVTEGFAKFSPNGQASALRLLGSLDEPEAARAFVGVLPLLSDSANVGSLGTLADHPRHADIFFPAVIAQASRPVLRWPLASLTLAYLSAGAVTNPTTKEEIAAAMGKLHMELKSVLLPLQKSEGVAWMWDDAYQEPRSLEALVLDVLGHVGSPSAERPLAEALHYTDPRLNQFAVLGLVRGKHAAPTEVIRNVAGSPECRNWLYRGLAEIGRLDLFPPEFASQAAFAEADMVNWLTYPTELERAPDEIELMAVLPRQYREGAADFFVFRFRTFEPHWAASKGWMAGVAGPFLRTHASSPDGGGGTFSTLAKWDDATPEQHLLKIEEILDSWRNAKKSDE